MSRKIKKGPNGEKYYSAYNALSKKTHFGICELSKNKAWKALYKEIGKDAYQYRWEIRQIGFNHPYVQHAYRVKKFKLPTPVKESEEA
ncbi:hypothetical protein B9R53_15025 [Listeria monocytogenes]|nr:hypothetical protein [Listeria monocytogenes]EAF0976871.1 hypothetical protein [Listeria monocytogenes]EAF2422714.1 hypothetical protein [Listeria monocytogenes]EAG4028508.1 hypothetical protein [Listeria monocytogenes]EAG4040962.1 hypothetical protein [Listeria monocytogenes]